MRTKRILAGAITAAALAGGTAGAVAATSGEQAAEQAVLSDAAKRLDVSAEALRSALAAAQDAQLDAAVKAGDLTREEADAIKERRRADGSVLRLGGGRHGGPGHHGGRRGRGQLMQDAAAALGLSRDELFERLREGRSLAQIAEAEGRTLAQVRSAVKAAATKRLDAALEAGRITRAQRTAMLEHLDEHLARLGEARPWHHRSGPKGPPPAATP